MRGEAKLTRFLCRETPSAGPLAQVPKVPSSRNFGPTTMDLRSGRRGGEAQVAGRPCCWAGSICSCGGPLAEELGCLGWAQGGERAARAGEEGERSAAGDLGSHAGAAHGGGCGAGAGERNGWEAIIAPKLI
jgi:hypothetical protein